MTARQPPAAVGIVTSDIDEAIDAIGAGRNVILVVSAEANLDLDRLRHAGAGRLGLFVGDIAQPATADAAAEMLSEVFARTSTNAVQPM